MRKERQAIADKIDEQLHTVEAAMHVVMTEYARLGLVVLEGRDQAKMSPLLGKRVLNRYSRGQKALTRFMGQVVEYHSELRDFGHTNMPGVAIGDTPTRPIRPQGESEGGPRLVASS